MRQLPDGPLKRRVLRTRSEVATLAGRLTFFDLRQPTEARGYYGVAHESATQADDDLLAAAALGHLAFLPAAEGNRQPPSTTSPVPPSTLAEPVCR